MQYWIMDIKNAIQKVGLEYYNQVLLGRNNELAFNNLLNEKSKL